jgi:hypothetical protein
MIRSIQYLLIATHPYFQTCSPEGSTVQGHVVPQHVKSHDHDFHTTHTHKQKDTARSNL